jgi:hypothetical protein
MEDRIKNKLKKVLPELVGIEKSEELIDAIEYINDIGVDERIETCISFLLDKCEELNHRNHALLKMLKSSRDSINKLLFSFTTITVIFTAFMTFIILNIIFK